MFLSRSIIHLLFANMRKEEKGWIFSGLFFIKCTSLKFVIFIIVVVVIVVVVAVV